MKVLAINGSPKENGNTAFAIKSVFSILEKENIDTEMITIGNTAIKGCNGCNTCARKRDEKCIFSDDIVNDMIQKMKKADGIILGSPVYYSAISGTMKAFLDRVFYVAGVNGGLFNHKVGAAVVAVRRSGGLPTFNQLNNYLNYNEMVMPTSNYWNVIHGLKPGDAEQDIEGKQIMRVLGKNIAWVLKMINATKDSISLPEAERKEFTHFIR